jgi:hypothetical protein
MDALKLTISKTHLDSFLMMDSPCRTSWRGSNGKYRALMALFKSRGWLVKEHPRFGWRAHVATYEQRISKFPIDFSDIVLMEPVTVNLEQAFSEELRGKSLLDGYVYLISDGHYTKIGISDNPIERLKDLSNANPKRLRLIASASVKHARVVERDLHQRYAAFRREREWFELTQSQQEEIAIQLLRLARE